MTEFNNNLRTGDQVFHVGRKQRGIVDRDPSPKSRETRVIFDGMVNAKRADVMDLRLIVNGEPEEHPPIDGEPPAAFVREHRYMVFKLSDVARYLDPAERKELARMNSMIGRCRRLVARGDLECVVVESDWPEYEPTWKAIEARVSSPKTS